MLALSGSPLDFLLRQLRFSEMIGARPLRERGRVCADPVRAMPRGALRGRVGYWPGGSDRPTYGADRSSSHYAEPLNYAMAAAAMATSTTPTISAARPKLGGLPSR